jgi:hypothetical protein
MPLATLMQENPIFMRVTGVFFNGTYPKIQKAVDP